jgi:hypothetical protein
MQRTFFILVAWLSLPLAATTGEPQDRAPLAPEVLRELETKWKAAIKVDSDAPDTPVVALSFSNCHAPEVTDDVLARLKVFPRLRKLTINSEAVSDQGLRRLRELPELRTLTLIRVPVTANGVDTLKGLSRLQQLTLFRIEISRTALKELREALPGTTVEWRER